MTEAYKLHEPLHRYTVARLGGPADRLIEVHDRSTLITVCTEGWQSGLPLRIIGAGANVLFSDQGFRGVIIVNRVNALTIEDSGTVVAGSGVSLPHLARETINHGLSGFEWAVGVPGTVGGATVNNAGAHGREMAHDVHAARLLVWEKGTAQQVTYLREDLDYHYRESALKHAPFPFVVLETTFQFSAGHDPLTLRTKADEYTAYRKRTQPPGASLGSMFKNPPGDYAGRLIEAAGLKGQQIGGVQISTVHANFFVNVGGGTAADYLALIQLAQHTVREKFGVELQLEVELIGY
jgi:UDP-N-acetylmuramate dehydrogenase